MPINGRCICNGEGWDGCHPDMVVVHDAALRRAIAADSATFTAADTAWAASIGITLGARDNARGPGLGGAAVMASGPVPLAPLVVGSDDPLWAIRSGQEARRG